MDELAMWVGYLVMALGAFSLVAFIAGVACSYCWRRLLKAVPSYYYVAMAVAHYRTIYPPSRWVREHLDGPSDAPKL